MLRTVRNILNLMFHATIRMTNITNNHHNLSSRIDRKDKTKSTLYQVNKFSVIDAFSNSNRIDGSNLVIMFMFSTITSTNIRKVKKNMYNHNIQPYVSDKPSTKPNHFSSLVRINCYPAR